MITYKKIFAISFIAFALLLGLTKIRTMRSEIVQETSRVHAPASLPKADVFNIMNVLFVKFR